MLKIEPINESSILKIIGGKLLYIHDLIDLAFEIKGKFRNKELDFSALIQPYGGSEWLCCINKFHPHTC